MGIPDIAVLVMVHNHTDTQMSVLVSCQSVKAITLKHLPSHVLKHSKILPLFPSDYLIVLSHCQRGLHYPS